MKTSVAITPKNGRHFAIDFFSRIFLLEREEDDDDDRESLDGVPSIDDDFFFLLLLLLLLLFLERSKAGKEREMRAD
tara:strand:- start:1758 stop:1988 length:231 start_codon:yes stop_codon:yes gene_type:complete